MGDFCDYIKPSHSEVVFLCLLFARLVRSFFTNLLVVISVVLIVAFTFGGHDDSTYLETSLPFLQFLRINQALDTAPV